MTFEISNIEELSMVSQDIANQIKPLIGKKSVLVCLCGDLGAGKTTFTKMLLKQLGVNNEVVSPTYILHNQYQGGVEGDVEINHLDLWRMEEISELTRIGFDEMVQRNTVIVVEWADKFEEKLKEYKNNCKLIWIKIEQGEKETSRTTQIEN